MSIWVDYSDIVTWPHQHLTGIQRVVIEVGLEMRLLKKDVKFFNYDPAAKKFFIVKPDTVEFARECKMNQIVTTTEEAKFASGDELYLLGGTWVHAAFVSVLAVLKQSAKYKVIQFVHDVTPIRVSHAHREKSKTIMETWLKELEPIVDVYLTNSEFSKKEISEVFREFGFKDKKLKVVRLGDALTVRGEGTKPAAFASFEKNFILCVGSIEPRKNHVLLYQAWKLLWKKYGEKTPQLVVVGRAGWQTDDLKALMFRDPDLKNKFLWLDKTSEIELAWLYQNCKFTTYASFYEGWGLPVAESLAYGRFCVASNAASIPEIAGDLIDYFDPYDSGDCFRKIEKCFFDQKYFETRTAEVKSKFKVTSWASTAKQCLEAGS